jgi:hypothetical protein
MSTLWRLPTLQLPQERTLTHRWKISAVGAFLVIVLIGIAAGTGGEAADDFSAPGTETQLGDHAWWLPRWLDRILPNVSLEGHLVEGLDAKEEREPEPAGVY